jgi:hypothetical protein
MNPNPSYIQAKMQVIKAHCAHEDYDAAERVLALVEADGYEGMAATMRAELVRFGQLPETAVAR